MSHRQRNFKPIKKEEAVSIGLSEEDADLFKDLHDSFLQKHLTSTDLDILRPPPSDFFVDYKSLPNVDESKLKEYLSQVIVIKLNGGQGTHLGLSTTKSTIELHDAFSFLDIAVQQVEYVNNTYGVDIPLILMNSFHTDAETNKYLTKYNQRNIKISTFVQHKFPRLTKDTLGIHPKDDQNPLEWYTPGGGDVYLTLQQRGLLKKYINEGKKYAFISNIENFGGVLGTNNFKLINLVFSQSLNFALEVTDRISTDYLGGILVQNPKSTEKNRVLLQELNQIPSEKLKHFNVKKFPFWNTNSVWVNLEALEKKITQGHFKLEANASIKRVEELQKDFHHLVTAVGTAIQSFQDTDDDNRSVAVIVPRTRYRSVKSTADLMILQSNLYTMFTETGRYVSNPARPFRDVPTVKLGYEHFATVRDYKKRIPHVPDLLELHHLTICGDVYIGPNVVFKGTVIIVANHGERIDIPEGAVLENKIIAGTLRILDH
eukprot:TRINITY_DN16531_c0_g1_i1.p1 TRINITY_DN16531_c0_g1~~TRINITY_DN16531_c0_g1_i1.p1  ORF type:complete len:488 (-),score=98.53 TRINITY_DN16531_c0_g1_i1:97-1560(-)